ncbi:MAG: UbiX family flavin prenyltransferase [Armatimonadetes bacterium]|nr:UbiX family flavin prenyltransferase [Armatimonadota bacterium]
MSARHIYVAVTGASGSPYARRFIQAAEERFDEVGLSISSNAWQVFREELGLDLRPDTFEVAALLGRPSSKIRYYHLRDMSAPYATGSIPWDAMVIVPCSMGTLARITHGISDSLITRAADVALKERRKLIVVPRDTPLSTIHLQNMLALAQAGAVVMPAAPGFYRRPQTIDDLVDFMVSRIMNHLL